MDVEELYDEFGNYIGPERPDTDSDSASDSDTGLGSKKTPLASTADEEQIQVTSHPDRVVSKNAIDSQSTEGSSPGSQAIVLPDDKHYYPSAEQIFGPDTEVLVEEEDAQQISEPLIAPPTEPTSGLHESSDSIPTTKYNRGYLASAVLPNPALIRNVAIVGHLHHGKTSFVDMLFDSTHVMPWSTLDDRDMPVRYTDTRQDEQALHISIKMTPATFLLQTSLEKSFGVTVLDTPGHLDFLDEAIAAMMLADGVAVLVDVAEGVMIGTETVLRRAASLRLDIVLVITKLDRLCLELRLPPQDAYHKIRHIIDSVNEIITPFGGKRLSPAHGNVAFAACHQRVCFTLPQFARQYIATHGGPDSFPMSARDLAFRFWGDVWFDREARKFIKMIPTTSSNRTFVQFILEPFYKLHTAVLSRDIDDLTVFLDRNLLLEQRSRRGKKPQPGRVRKRALDANIKSMLTEVNRNVFNMGSMAGFTEMVVTHLKSPDEATVQKVEVLACETDENIRTGSQDGLQSEPSPKQDTSSSSGFIGYVGKLVPDERGEELDCLVRVLKGNIRRNDEIYVLGKAFDRQMNKDDQALARVTDLFLPGGRFKIPCESASSGQIVLVRGIHNTVFKSATIVSKEYSMTQAKYPLRSLESFLSVPVVKVAVEPVKPSELPKMVASLRKCVNTFPGLITKVEDTGEHTLTGSGELYLDCVLRDMREGYGSVELKVSDPVVPFSETVTDTSALQCYADTPNKQNKFVMVAEPLEDSVLDSLENGVFGRTETVRSDVLRENGWDALAVKSLWTFGPDTTRGPNALLNDVLIQDSRRRVEDVRDSVVQGFEWAMREGPLADEPVRAVKLRLIDASIAQLMADRSPAQVIPTCRRVTYSSILTANPRLMEPVYATEIVCLPESLSVAHMLIGRRRGTALSESDIAGTPLKRAIVHIPVLDSFGFEADLRNLTHGTAFCSNRFDHWEVVPGDPLDRSVTLKTLEPAGRHELARECMIKTRRRKGMPDEVSVTKYFDDPLLVELAADNPELQQLL